MININVLIMEFIYKNVLKTEKAIKDAEIFYIQRLINQNISTVEYEKIKTTIREMKVLLAVCLKIYQNILLMKKMFLSLV